MCREGLGEGGGGREGRGVSAGLILFIFCLEL